MAAEKTCHFSFLGPVVDQETLLIYIALHPLGSATDHQILCTFMSSSPSLKFTYNVSQGLTLRYPS